MTMNAEEAWVTSCFARHVAQMYLLACLKPSMLVQVPCEVGTVLSELSMGPYHHEFVKKVCENWI